MQCLVYPSHFFVSESWAQRQLTDRCITHSFEGSEIGCKGQHIGLVDGSDHPEAVLKFREVVIIDLEQSKCYIIRKSQQLARSCISIYV